ncbi:glycoside hydrolase [Scenedesmus sp. NREL 46B-D3]|nr:glycoside hydrolase [Scenedesmus sp. NREL 46B-D3]
MALKQPANGVLPRRAPTPYDRSHSNTGCEWFYIVAVTVSASALLATLITFGALNFLMSDVQLPRHHAFGQLQSAATVPQPQLQPVLQQQIDGRGAVAPVNTTTPAAANASQAAHLPAAAPPQQPPPAAWRYPLKYIKGYYKLPPQDTSSRCQQSKICDGDHSCGPDGLGCITSAKERQDKVRDAIAWAWAGYRQHAWGYDEVNGLSKTPRGWFNMGLTIVDSLDTLMIAGLHEEYQQARHWVANHLQFKDGSSVQFFEVNIRILGGLLSAYYLSDGDDMYLHKAQQLGDRLMVAFNTSSGMPVSYVQFANAEGRRRSGHSDSGTNAAEAGTISMEFTTIGRLLGRDDMFDAGNQFWYVLMNSQNYSGLYCMGLHTQDGHCTDNKMSIGSAADSMYEYMIKQWVLSGKTQEVPLQLYKESMVGVRKHLLRHIFDGTSNMSFVSEARGISPNDISATNDRFEHLTCFAGGMFLLGRMHNITTKLHEDDYDDAEVGARIGRACYEMYHQVPSGVAPDSIQFSRLDGGSLPPNDHSPRSRAPAPKVKAQRKRSHKKGQPAGNATAVGGARTAGAPAQPPTDSKAAQHEAPKPADAAGEVEKPQQAKRAPKPADAAHEVQPGVIAHAPKPQDTAQQQQGGAHAPGGAEGGQAPATRRLLGGQEVPQQLKLQHSSQEASQQPRGAVMLGEQLQQLAEMVQQQDALQQQADTQVGAHHVEQQQEQEEEQQEQQVEVTAEGGAAAIREGNQSRRAVRRLMAEGDLAPADDAHASAGGDAADDVTADAADADAAGADAADADAAGADAANADAAGADAAGADSAPEADGALDADGADGDAAHDAPYDADNDDQQAGAAAPPPPPNPPPPPPNPPPPPPNPPPPSPPPPPPPGPIVAKWSQLSSSDFLRPEAIETLFYLWRASGDPIYREWGWNMFRGFERWCRLTSGGYATLNNVNAVPPGIADKMESFFVAETLKYFYMLFEEDPTVLPLDQWVFNTEAHPFPIWGTPPDKRAQERLRQRRLAQLKLQQRRQAEEAALQEQEALQRLTQQVVGGKGKPQDRDGYGLAGLA